MLSIGYVFVLPRALDEGGSRVWPIALFWTVVGMGLGQIAIQFDIVPTYLRTPYVHGLAALCVSGDRVRHSLARHKDRTE